MARCWLGVLQPTFRWRKFRPGEWSAVNRYGIRPDRCFFVGFAAIGMCQQPLDSPIQVGGHLIELHRQLATVIRSMTICI